MTPDTAAVVLELVRVAQSAILGAVWVLMCVVVGVVVLAGVALVSVAHARGGIPIRATVTPRHPVLLRRVETPVDPAQ